MPPRPRSAAIAARAQSGWLDEGKLGILDHDVGIGVHHAEPGAMPA